MLCMPLQGVLHRPCYQPTKHNWRRAKGVRGTVRYLPTHVRCDVQYSHIAYSTISLRPCYVMSGTGRHVCVAICLHARYAMSGTDLGCRATSVSEHETPTASKSAEEGQHASIFADMEALLTLMEAKLPLMAADAGICGGEMLIIVEAFQSFFAGNCCHVCRHLSFQTGTPDTSVGSH
eukprot:2386752-Rhodomonas_salina.3